MLQPIEGVFGIKKSDIISVLILIVTFGLLSLTTKCVPVGHKGVVKHWGQVNHKVILNEGLNFITPIRTTVININSKLLKFDQESAASSKDLQMVKTVVTVQFSLLEVSELFQKIGIERKIISVTLIPAIQESVKAVTALYTAEHLITRRAQVKSEIAKSIADFLKLTMESKGLSANAINIENVAITDFAFSEEFNKSIEMKVRAEQKALQAKNEKIKKITDAEAVAEQIRIESIARANAIKREARALRENPLLIEYKRMEKWDGKLPEVTGGAIPMFDIRKKNEKN